MYKVIGADGKEYGPITAEQVRQWIRERRLNNQSLIQPEGETGWKPLSFFPEFATDMAQASPPATASSGTGPTNNLAIASLVLGIASWVCCCNVGVLNVLSIVFGFMALSQIRARPDEGGKVLAIVGMALASVQLLISIIGISFGLVGTMIEALKNM
jgi:hypothetical protein